MSQALSRWQAALLGLVVLSAGGLAAVGLTRVAARQGLWAETTEVTVGFPEAHDLAPGTPVRVRGVDAGQVVAVEYPDADGPESAVTVRLRLDAKYAARLYADATAQVQPTGLLGQKVIAVRPGTPAAGPLIGGRLKAAESQDVAQAAAKLAAVADEAAALLKEVRSGPGTVSKLLTDDELYRDLKGLANDSRGLVKKADQAVGTVESEAGNVRELVADGRETLRSVRQGTDAMQKLPLVRGYVEDPVALLARPDCRREMVWFDAAALFEPGTAILTPAGRDKLAEAGAWVKGHPDKAEVVVAARHDPADQGQTPGSAAELTRKRAEAGAEFLRASGANKIGWWSRRKTTAVGLGSGPPPVPEKEALPPAYLQVVVFTPAG